MATRTFDRRVNSFVKEYITGNAAGMQVELYSYKVEFQQRGAGHVHGVLWLDTDALGRTEWIQKDSNDPENSESEDFPKLPTVTETIPNSEVRVHSKEDWKTYDQEKIKKMNLPFRGLTAVMKKLGQKGGKTVPLFTTEQQVLANTVNHL